MVESVVQVSHTFTKAQQIKANKKLSTITLNIQLEFLSQQKQLTFSRTFLALADIFVLSRRGLWRMLSYISAVSRL